MVCLLKRWYGKILVFCLNSQWYHWKVHFNFLMHLPYTKFEHKNNKICSQLLCWRNQMGGDFSIIPSLYPRIKAHSPADRPCINDASQLDIKVRGACCGLLLLKQQRENLTDGRLGTHAHTLFLIKRGRGLDIKKPTALAHAWVECQYGI